MMCRGHVTEPDLKDGLIEGSFSNDSRKTCLP